MNKEELKREIYFSNLTTLVHGINGNIKLELSINIFTNELIWIISEGDHKTYFKNDFEQAFDYYCNAINII